MPSPGRTRTLRSMVCLSRDREGAVILVCRDPHRLLAALLDERENLLVHEAFFAMVGDRRKAVVQRVQLLPGEVEAKFLAALVKRMPSAVLAENQFALRHAD